MNAKNTFYIVLLLAILGGGYWWYTQNQSGDQMAPLNAFIENTPPVEQKAYSSSEVSTHNSIQDCWVIINSKVINVTNFISLHPGGANKITRVCGTDITERYNKESAHAQTIANAVINKITIGNLIQ